MDECLRRKHCSAMRKEIHDHMLCLHPKSQYLYIASRNNIHCEYREVIEIQPFESVRHYLISHLTNNK